MRPGLTAGRLSAETLVRLDCPGPEALVPSQGPIENGRAMAKDTDNARAFLRWPWSAAAAALLSAGAVFPPDGIPGVNLCWLYSATGVPCPACGLTRSFSAIVHGEFAHAWRMNPFGYVVFAGTLVLLLGPILRRVVPCLEDVLFRRRIGLAVGWALLCALVVFGLLRLCARWHPVLGRLLHIETWGAS